MQLTDLISTQNRTMNISYMWMFCVRMRDHKIKMEAKVLWVVQSLCITLQCNLVGLKYAISQGMLASREIKHYLFRLFVSKQTTM